jgi:small subunit ribosomal protein S20
MLVAYIYRLQTTNYRLILDLSLNFLYRLRVLSLSRPVPIIKSAIKRARQNDIRRERRQPHKTRLKTVIRSYMDLVKEGKKDEAQKMLPQVFKVIDTACKKHIIHRNTANRKKSGLSKMVAAK